MKIKTILLIPFLFIIISVNGQNKTKEKILFLENQINTLSKEIDSNQQKMLEQSKEIKELSNKIEYQGNLINNQTVLIDTSFDGVSSQLSASSYFIGIFGIIIALFSIGLSIYVSRMSRNIKNISLDNETLLQKNVTIKQEIELLSEKIVNDSTGLYKVMRTEEANHILDRLISVPEDISNMFSNLASRELNDNHFLQMKEAYTQIKDDEEFADSYLIQFFQHFAGLSVIDEEIKDNLLSKLDMCVKCSFKNDIVNSTQNYISALQKKGLNNSKSEINIFVKIIENSKYKDLEELYFSVFNTLSTRNAQFAFFQIINKTDNTKLFRKNYGKLLENYKTENTTDDENLVFEELENLNQ
ncbi:hypothetical protein C8N26_0480 [Tenacibaculum lutimaris]|uniref:Uncharacterized protein n=1 Tax=Tenacibaculum lutimaris TaxID=285258 RepID=A0A420E4W2_9FLAO|nr:hypothetical protein [Tenacibaculum lutimaris]RKF05080.1 hypothetical protein C8N26_0480 [Tenacibaculum lutimaris]